jgi:hypothetical protein
MYINSLISFFIDVVYNAYSYFFSAKTSVASSPDAFPVADRSLLLLLLLSTQFKNGSAEDGERNEEQDLQWASAYRQAIAEIPGDQDPVIGSQSEKTLKDEATGSISFRQLYSIFAGFVRWFVQVESISLKLTCPLSE